MILVSACLLGYKVRHDGGGQAEELLMDDSGQGRWVAVCPESMGGLPTPRAPLEIWGGDGRNVLEGKAEVCDKAGANLAPPLIKGASLIWQLARRYGIKTAILKENSPSCGVRRIYDGTFTGRLKDGEGVLTAVLRARGFRVYSEKDLTKELLKRLI